jgi:hypothetical protein
MMVNGQWSMVSGFTNFEARDSFRNRERANGKRERVVQIYEFTLVPAIGKAHDYAELASRETANVKRERVVQFYEFTLIPAIPDFIGAGCESAIRLRSSTAIACGDGSKASAYKSAIAHDYAELASRKT